MQSDHGRWACLFVCKHISGTERPAVILIPHETWQYNKKTKYSKGIFTEMFSECSVLHMAVAVSSFGGVAICYVLPVWLEAMIVCRGKLSRDTGDNSFLTVEGTATPLRQSVVTFYLRRVGEKTHQWEKLSRDTGTSQELSLWERRIGAAALSIFCLISLFLF